MTVLKVTDQDSRADIEATLAVLVHAAKREVPAVGNDLHATPWDLAHRRIDAVLEDWERAGA